MVSLFQFNASKIPQMLPEILINMLSGEGQMSPIKFDLKLCGANYKHKTLTQTDRTNKTINFYSPKKEQRNKKSKAEIQVTAVTSLFSPHFRALESRAAAEPWNSGVEWPSIASLWAITIVPRPFWSPWNPRP